MKMLYKFVADAIVSDRTLGDRQVRVRASDPTPDRDGDILLPSGCDYAAFKSNPTVLAEHDRFRKIGTARIVPSPSAVDAIVTFAPAGISATADEYCGLAKAGVVNAVSVGFRPIEAEPRGNGRGMLWKLWELLEISFVAVGSNPSAIVLERSFMKDGRVLSAANAAHVAEIEKCLVAMGDHGGRALDHVKALKAAGRVLPDDGDGADPEDAPDQELSLSAWRRRAADRRKRQVAIAQARFGPPSAAESAAFDRRRAVERRLWGP